MVWAFMLRSGLHITGSEHMSSALGFKTWIWLLKLRASSFRLRDLGFRLRALTFSLRNLCFGLGVFGIRLWLSAFVLLAWTFELKLLSFEFQASGLEFCISDCNYQALVFGLSTAGFWHRLLSFKFWVLGFEL
ncbi:hypothetical protein AXF42_Ash004849 [Apostasia shenzhenica]|uniref:Uncharacterized protein n=1 Tax=Apostasia shenzhenica TaxID=1088818 RepID=A0A2I0B7S8_9ASPA|nr:hypothetical protein AXF42_Ash004849 [Apostasia shenzhenica]